MVESDNEKMRINIFLNAKNYLLYKQLIIARCGRGINTTKDINAYIQLVAEGGKTAFEILEEKNANK